MAETTYTYGITADMPGGAVNPGKLIMEVEASAIATSIVDVNTKTDILKIVFADALSAGDKTILDNDATGPAGGLLAAHDNAANPDPITKVVHSDPKIYPVNASKGSTLIWNGRHYHKDDDGSSTNVSPADPVETGVGQAGGFLFNYPEYTTDPVTPIANDVWIRNTANVRRLVFYDGTNKHAVVLTQE